ncbi:MAG: META domain-containing protein [Aestuariivirga sp.]|uniref:META domain-containing protein n=1 Tax=Aestuariivirga sp. TaxID=2650926 RepID=UPI00301A7693
MRRIIIVISCLLLGLMAGPVLAHPDKLAGADWVLAGQTGERAPYLRFDGGRVGGLSGCNRFGGRYEADGDMLAFSPMMATRMACRPDIMKAEQTFMDMLAKVKAMVLDSDRLELLDGEGKVLATFDRRVAQ